MFTQDEVCLLMMAAYASQESSSHELCEWAEEFIREKNVGEWWVRAHKLLLEKKGSEGPLRTWNGWVN